ncbi:MAG: SPFH domain-containing protein [Bacilli bacterium]|nr:SPFH domain-containing protein [Bacilli bacterium]
MGLIKTALAAGSSVLADQWLEYIYCERMEDNVLMRKGVSKQEGSNTKGTDNVITNGSKIVVGEDQFLIVVSDGKIVDFTAEPGQYTFDQGTEPSMFYGGFGKGLIESFKKFGERFTTGGVAPHDQRVYFVNTRLIKGNKFGTTTPIPFRDSEFGITVDIRCYGEYVMEITDPLAFYHSYGGNIEEDYIINESFKDTFLADFLQALQPALAKVAMQRISYDMLPGAVTEISAAVKECLQDTWGSQGINVERVSIASATPTEESADMIKSAQGDRLYAMNPAMQGARANAAASEALVEAAGNESGSMTGFMGMGMLNQGGAMFGANISAQAQNNEPMDVMNVFGGGVEMPEPTVEEPKVEEVKTEGVPCPNCGNIITANFCTECGTKKPEEPQEKFCTNCGEKALENAKFCMNCGTKL